MSYDFMDNTRRLDYGLIFGAGYRLDLGGATLELSGRYHHGLAEVSGLGHREYDLRTRELAVVLGFIF